MQNFSNLNPQTFEQMYERIGCRIPNLNSPVEYQQFLPVRQIEPR